jgi:hypothetical protein
MPDCLNPPKLMARSMQNPLCPTVPDWSSPATYRALSASLVKTEAFRPYGESFAILIASSSPSAGMTLRTGPKISS